MGTKTINIISAFLVSIALVIGFAIICAPVIYGITIIAENEKLKGWMIITGWIWLIFFTASLQLIKHFNKNKNKSVNGQETGQPK